MTQDQLSPEDRALYDAFFNAYGAKLFELKSAAAEGAEISLDVCAVHAIKVIVDREIERRYFEIIPPIEPAPRIVSAVGVGVRVKPQGGERVAGEVASAREKEMRAQHERDRLAGEVERAQIDQRHSSAEWYKCIQLKEAAEAERDRLKAALREHHNWHLNAGAIGLPDDKGGWVEIDNAAEYSDSELCSRTIAALGDAS